MTRHLARIGLQSLALLAVLTAASTDALANFQDPPERVVVRLDQFLDMYEKAKARVDEPERPPRTHALSSAAYEGEVLIQDGEPRFARFDATIRVEVLHKKGWARIPVLPATVALHSATVNGKEVAVVIEDGFYTLITEQKGAFNLE